jgi:hypothetical protein
MMDISLEAMDISRGIGRIIAAVKFRGKRESRCSEPRKMARTRGFGELEGGGAAADAA